MNRVSDDNESVDSHVIYYDTDLTVLEACVDYDVDSLQAILEDKPTDDELNERDRCGRTGLSYACANGYASIVELLSESEELDPNIPDKDGNTPLIFASQAGHNESVRLLLNKFRRTRVDQTNKAGFTALMKAAIQGRKVCAKLLLLAGASSKVKDFGRKYCAEEWAHYCGRKECAELIDKFANTRRLLYKTKHKGYQERSMSEPDLTVAGDNLGRQVEHSSHHRSKSKWLRKKVKKLFHSKQDIITRGSGLEQPSPFAIIGRCVSTPLLPELASPTTSQGLSTMQHNADNLSRIPKVQITSPVDLTNVKQPDSPWSRMDDVFSPEETVTNDCQDMYNWDFVGSEV